MNMRMSKWHFCGVNSPKNSDFAKTLWELKRKMGPGPCSYYPPAWSCLWMVIFREIARFDWENLGQPVAATIIAAWWFGTFFYFSIQLGIMIPTDTYKFQRGWNHQPDWYLTILAHKEPHFCWWNPKLQRTSQSPPKERSPRAGAGAVARQALLWDKRRGTEKPTDFLGWEYHGHIGIMGIRTQWEWEIIWDKSVFPEYSNRHIWMWHLKMGFVKTLRKMIFPTGFGGHSIDKHRYYT